MRVSRLVQVLLPLHARTGAAQPRDLFSAVRDEVLARFGGMTAYTRAPAQGLWEAESGHVARDEIVIYEVLCDVFDEAWWTAYRATLRERFDQDEILVRIQEVRTL